MISPFYPRDHLPVEDQRNASLRYLIAQHIYKKFQIFLKILINKFEKIRILEQIYYPNID